MSNIKTESIAEESSYARLQSHICNQISRGELKPGQKLHTSDMAKEWNISKGTVNQSLHTLAAKGILVRKRRSGTYVGESPVKLKNIEEASNTIAVILPDLQQPEFSRLVEGIRVSGKNSHINVAAYDANNDTAQFSQLIQGMIKQNCAAIVFAPPVNGAIPVETLMDIYNSKIPVVLCWREVGGFGWPIVMTDQAYNTEIAARHLCELGRKSIGLVSIDSPNSHYALIKEHAFFKTIDEYGLATKRSLSLSLPVCDGVSSAERMWLVHAMDVVEVWLNTHPEIDGVCCLHDFAAWAVISAITKMGKKIPQDVAVVGNGDVLQSVGFVRSDLTTVDICYQDIADAIVNWISRMRAGGIIDIKEVSAIRGKLIVRHSTVGSRNGYIVRE